MKAILKRVIGVGGWEFEIIQTAETHEYRTTSLCLLEIWGKDVGWLSPIGHRHHTERQ